MSDSHEIGSQRGRAGADMPATYDITANIRDDLREIREEADANTAQMLHVQEVVEGLHDEHAMINVKLDMIAETLSIAPSPNEKVEVMWEGIRELNEATIGIVDATAKLFEVVQAAVDHLEMIEATLANIQQQLQAIHTRIYSRS